MKKIFTLLSVAAFSATFAQSNKSQIQLDKSVRDMSGNIETFNNTTYNSRVDSYNFGFEASQGFTLGTINNQNGWATTSAGPDNPVLNQDITTELVFDGEQSLKIAQDSRFPQQTTATGGPSPIVGAHYNFGSTLQTAGIEMYVQPFFDGGTTYQIGTVNTVAAEWRDQIRFYMDDETVYIADWEDGYYRLADVTISEDTWYKVNIEYNPVEGTVEYKFDDQVVYTRDAVAADQMQYNEIRLGHDNVGITSFMYIDGPDALAVSDVNSRTKISVYPNPATDFVNIQNTKSEKIQAISLGDLTGRTIKHIDVNETKVSLSGLPKGVYLLKIKTDKGMSVQKVIKK